MDKIPAQFYMLFVTTGYAILLYEYRDLHAVER